MDVLGAGGDMSRKTEEDEVEDGRLVRGSNDEQVPLNKHAGRVRPDVIGSIGGLGGGGDRGRSIPAENGRLASVK